VNEITNRPNTAPNRFSNVSKDIETISANSHKTFEIDTQVRANEEMTIAKAIIPAREPKSVFKSPDPLAKLSKIIPILLKARLKWKLFFIYFAVQPNYEDMAVEDLSLNYTNESVIRTIADIHNHGNIDTIKTL
jgi:hypothetical protein